MTETGNTTHSARVDDALAGAVDAEEEVDFLVEEPTTPLPGPLTEHERLGRSELAMALRPSAFPADRGVLLQVARSEQAPDEILLLLERLPIDTRFDTVQDVWEAVGGHREARDPIAAAPAPPASAPASAVRPAPAAAPGPNVVTRALGVVAGGLDLAFSAAQAVIARAKEIRAELGDPEFVMLVDRLDYTKGIQQRVKAVGELFAECALSAPRQVMIQIAVPSRGEDAHYEREREEVERLVGEVNGTHAQVGHAAIHYLHQSVDADEFIALYLAADVMLVTPLRDGMNLVAKEYVASRLAPTGALVLSEFAGTARELSAAYLVNPHDLDSIKEAIRKVIDLDPIEARARMRRLRHVVGRNDVHTWARDFLTALQLPAQIDLTDRIHPATTAASRPTAFESVA